MTPTTRSCCSKSSGPTVQLHDHREIQVCYHCLAWMNAKRDEQVSGHDGGWRAIGFEPIFVVTDIARALDHYTKMGFEVSSHDETYAFAHRERNLTIHLALGDGAPSSGALYTHCEDADELAAQWRHAGLEVLGPTNEDYGQREGSHRDPDGNLVRFGSPLR